MGYSEEIQQGQTTVLLNKTVASRPSITDNGKLAVFVGTDKKLYQLSLDPSLNSEKQFSKIKPFGQMSLFQKMENDLLLLQNLQIHRFMSMIMIKKHGIDIFFMLLLIHMV